MTSLCFIRRNSEDEMIMVEIVLTRIICQILGPNLVHELLALPARMC